METIWIVVGAVVVGGTALMLWRNRAGRGDGGAAQRDAYNDGGASLLAGGLIAGAAFEDRHSYGGSSSDAGGWSGGIDGGGAGGGD